MNTIKILDNYKISLTEDPIYLKVLSIIFLYFKITEEDLYKLVPALHDRKVLMSELFKSGLIVKDVESNTISLTKKAEIILEGFDINEIVLKEFIRELPINEFDKIFLEKSIEYFKNNDINKKDLRTLLRTLFIFSQALNKDEKYVKIISENAFIIIFHLNTFNLNLSNEILFNEIKLRIFEDDNISSNTKRAILRRKNVYIGNIGSCHYSFLDSNSQHFSSYVYKNKMNKSDYDKRYFLTTLRHTNLFYHGYCDSELFNITVQFNDAISPFINFDSEIKLGFVHRFENYFNDNFHVGNKQFSVKTLLYSFAQLKKNYSQGNVQKLIEIEGKNNRIRGFDSSIRMEFDSPFSLEGISARDFRKQKIEIKDYMGIIITSRNATDHFFRICEELKIEVSRETKYFCISEAVALYLQKFILYRKRKVFYGVDGSNKSLFDIIDKHKENEKFLYVCSENHQDNDIVNWLKANNVEFVLAFMYRTIGKVEKELLTKAEQGNP